MNNLMPPEMLDDNIRDELRLRLKKHFRIFRLFGAWIFGLSLAGTIGFVINFFTDESWNEGNLAPLPIKIMLFLITSGFFLLLLKFTYWVFSFPNRKVRAVDNGDFTWKSGNVTSITSTYRTSSTNPSGYTKHRVVHVDNERVEMLHSSLNLVIGDPMYVFCIEEKNPIVYAMSNKSI